MTTPAAQSFLVSLQAQPNQRASVPFRIFERTLVERMRLLKSPSGALVFVSGGASAPPAIAKIIASVAPDHRARLVPGAGVLTEAGEVEGAPAASALVFGGSKVALEVGSDAIGTEKGAHVVFATRRFGENERERLPASTFGGGAAGDAIQCVDKGAIASASVASLVISGYGAPVVEESASCRQVAGPFLVTAMEDGKILELDGSPALDLLSKTTGGGKFAGLVVAALTDATTERSLFRPIKGVDPGRKALLVDASLEVGDQLGFAVRDATFAKTELTEAARRAERAALGSAACFAVFVSSSGRGRTLYRESDVDVRILKKRFPKLPIAGMHAAYEVVPSMKAKDGVAIQQMSGVLALFRSAS